MSMTKVYIIDDHPAIIEGLKTMLYDNEENIDIAWVPGAFEIPFIAKYRANILKPELDCDLWELYNWDRE